MVTIGTLLTKATTVKLVTKDYLTESSCFLWPILTKPDVLLVNICSIN